MFPRLGAIIIIIKCEETVSRVGFKRIQNTFYNVILTIGFFKVN